jgi:hypothetical protein
MVVLGVLLIAVGVFWVMPRGMAPGRVSNVDLSGGHAFPNPRKTKDNQTAGGKFEGVRVGLGLIALGGLCIAIGSLT